MEFLLYENTDTAKKKKHTHTHTQSLEDITCIQKSYSVQNEKTKNKKHRRRRSSKCPHLHYFVTRTLSLDTIIPCGWLGSKHQLTKKIPKCNTQRAVWEETVIHAVIDLESDALGEHHLASRLDADQSWPARDPLWHDGKAARTCNRPACQDDGS